MRQFGTRVLPGSSLDMPSTREEVWTGDLCWWIRTEDLHRISPSEIHVNRFKSKDLKHLKKTVNLFSHVGRAKSCKRDSRDRPLGTMWGATSRGNLRTINSSDEKKKKPQIQIQM